MRLMYNLKTILGAFSLLFTLGFSSCNFLDVIPPEQAGLKDATKDYDSTLGFLYSCFGGVFSPFFYSTVEATSDEWVLPPLWNETTHKMSYNLLTPSAVGEWRWGAYYQFIGQCHLFLSELPKAKEVTEEQKDDFQAMAEFAIAYYHMALLQQYGPIPITDSYVPMDTPATNYNGRYHFDYVVDWLVERFDDLSNRLPPVRESSQWGLPTSTMCKALKARLLLTAASPLWNGRFPYPNWKNKEGEWETPGYGKELVSHSYSREKWVRAEQACKEALEYALTNGYRLYTDEDLYARENLSLPYVPGVNKDTPEGKQFLKKVMLLRYLVTTRVNEGNKEIIWGSFNQGNMLMGSLPHAIMKLNNGSFVNGYSGVSPLLNTTISYFYTKNGKRPALDPSFVKESEWFKSANISGRPNIINLNVNREPRFYAWFAFDDGDYMNRIVNGMPLRINLRDGERQGYNPANFNRDNNVTGWFSQKYVMPKLQFNLDGSNNAEAKPRPLIRLAELYLSLAECQAELGKSNESLENLNIIRRRAGVPDLTGADVTSKMSLTDWVRNERFVELWGEGHRYYDIRRWMIAPATMSSGKRTGLNAYGIVNPTFEQLNEPVRVNQAYEWSNRMYLLPLFQNEVYKNPNLVQSPGYN